jgi:hypothetical protein
MLLILLMRLMLHSLYLSLTLGDFLWAMLSYSEAYVLFPKFNEGLD